mgnify:CR=1 FL=1
MFPVLIAFLAVPVVEIALFIQVGGWLGLVPTLAIVIATAVIGTALLRRQGLATLARARNSMERGTVPVVELFDGICLLLAGALLLTPGFVTDALGAVLLVPALRQFLRVRIARRLFENTGAFVHRGRTEAANANRADIIDGEFSEIDPEDNTDSKTARPQSDKKEPDL